MLFAELGTSLMRVRACVRAWARGRVQEGYLMALNRKKKDWVKGYYALVSRDDADNTFHFTVREVWGADLAQGVSNGGPGRARLRWWRRRLWR